MIISHGERESVCVRACGYWCVCAGARARVCVGIGVVNMSVPW